MTHPRDTGPTQVVSLEPSAGFAPMATWLDGYRYDDIPRQALKAGKQCLLDGLACLLAGLHTQPVADYREVLQLNSVNSAGIAPVGAGTWAGLFDAANLYAHAANILDFDDCYRQAPSHPGATIIGPALACAHLLKSDGRETLAAIIKAYEASLRIGTALCPSDNAPSKDIGYATWQIFGAFIAAGVLLRLDRRQWTQGFGLAAQQAPVPMIVRANPHGGYTWLKNAYGAAAAAGVMAAFLARQGYAADQHFFSKEFGFWKIYGSDRFRPECLNTLPGDNWLIRRVEFKPWACCRWAHPALEATLRLKPSIDLRRLESIEVHAFKEFCDTLDSPYPTNLIDSQFNVRFLIAVALLHDDLNTALRAPDFDCPQLRALFSRITVHRDSQCDARRRVDMSIPTRVVIRLQGEPSRELFVAEPLGSGRRGIASMEETMQKFRTALSPLMPEARIQRTIEIVTTLERHTAAELMTAAFPQA